MPPITSFPRSATLCSEIERNEARLSVKPGTLPPPPTTKTALTGLPPFSSIILSAISFVMLSTVSLYNALALSAVITCGSPIIS